MRYLAYASGIVFKAAGVLLVLTAAVLWVLGKPNTKIIFIIGAIFLAGGAFIKRASWLKKCPRCFDKAERDAPKCRHCGFDFSTASESLSQPFYK